MSDAATLRPVHPVAFFFLNLPFGIVGGYLVAVFPFIAARFGLPVATVASVVAIGLLPKTWKFLWSPVADIKFTLKIWYRIGAFLAGAMLLVQGFVLLRHGPICLVAATAFVAEFGASLFTLALGGLMANAVPAQSKGRAAGWYQAGGKAGHGIAATIGIWLATHQATSVLIGALFGFGCAACTFLLPLLDEPRRSFEEELLWRRGAAIAKDIWSTLRTLNGALLVPLVLLPIGISGVANFWPAVASEWHVSGDTVAWVNGIGYSVICAGGAIVGGRCADQVDRRYFFLAAGALVSLVGIGLAIAPHIAAVFVVGVLAQELAIGLSDAAWSAVVLDGIGGGAAATKFAVLAGIGNAPDLYMTVLSGWVHDRWNARIMLTTESGISLLCIAFMLVLLLRISPATTVQVAFPRDFAP